MENDICNSMILTSRRRHFYLVGRSKLKVGAFGVNNQASEVLAGNELPFVAFICNKLGEVSVGREVEKMSISQSSPWATAVNKTPPFSNNTETEKQ
ncbi:hypothetical protein TNCV_3436281 [Trichonephila clavipes]|nr:hypothetical protein TNCV_3436281 [Trichonephila clavipes]